MKKTIKLIVCAFCMLMPQFGMAQSNWDAATCMDICTILTEQGSVTDNVLVRGYGYKLVNNIPIGGDYSNGYLSLYTLNMTCDVNGNVVRLGQKGISNYLLIGYGPDGEMSIATAFFSAANAAKFRQQAIDAGFQKTRTVKGETYYSAPGVEMSESSKRFGRYTAYSFAFKLDM